MRTVDTQDTNSKYLCGSSFAKFFSFCACSAACCVSCCSCFLCAGLYSCLRKIFFGSGSHTHPIDGVGEESKADFYIGGVPQDKSMEISRLRNELREVCYIFYIYHRKWYVLISDENFHPQAGLPLISLYMLIITGKTRFKLCLVSMQWILFHHDKQERNSS